MATHTYKLPKDFKVDDYFSITPWKDWNIVSFLLAQKSRKRVTSIDKRHLHSAYTSSLEKILTHNKLPLNIKNKLERECSMDFSNHEGIKKFWKDIQAEMESERELSEAAMSYTRNLEFIQMNDEFHKKLLAARKKRHIAEVDGAATPFAKKILTDIDDAASTVTSKPFEFSNVEEEEEEQKSLEEETLNEDEGDNSSEEEGKEKTAQRFAADNHTLEELHEVTTEESSTILPSLNLVSVLRQYCVKPTTSKFDPARSYILDMGPNSKVMKEFNLEQWAQLLEDKRVKAPHYHHEIKAIMDKLFGPIGVRRSTLNLVQARQRWKELNNLSGPPHSEEFSYNKDQWEKMLWWAGRAVGQFLDAFESCINPLESCDETEWLGGYIIPLLEGVLKLDGFCRVPWGEISVRASQHRRNHNRDLLTVSVERAHLADMLCLYGNQEVLCLLACGGPYKYDLTKLASDEFHFKRMMKDMLDALHTKFRDAGMDGSGLYVLGVQTYLADVRIYLMEKREVYRLHLLTTFSLPLSFASFRNLRVAIKWAWNLRALVNELAFKLDSLGEDTRTPSPKPFSDELETMITPSKAQKIKSLKDSGGP